MSARAQQRPDLDDVLVEHVGHPVHLRHRQHRAPLRRVAPRRLAVADEHRTSTAVLAHLRIGSQVDQIEHHRLAPAQPKRVHHFQERGVPHSRQHALTALRADLLYPTVGAVEQSLHFVVGQRAPAGPALEVADVHHRVPLVQDLHRDLPEPLLTRAEPAVARIGDVAAEQPQRQLVATGSRHRHRLRTGVQAGKERLRLGRLPLPRVLIRELGEPPNQRQTWPDRARPQEPRALLLLPPSQHRREDRRLRVQMDHVPCQHQAGRTGQLATHRPVVSDATLLRLARVSEVSFQAAEPDVDRGDVDLVEEPSTETAPVGRSPTPRRLPPPHAPGRGHERMRR